MEGILDSNALSEGRSLHLWEMMQNIILSSLNLLFHSSLEPQITAIVLVTLRHREMEKMTEVYGATSRSSSSSILVTIPDCHQTSSQRPANELRAEDLSPLPLKPAIFVMSVARCVPSFDRFNWDGQSYRKHCVNSLSRRRRKQRYYDRTRKPPSSR